jgi:hypothetical protein
MSWEAYVERVDEMRRACKMERLQRIELRGLNVDGRIMDMKMDIKKIKCDDFDLIQQARYRVSHVLLHPVV